MGTHFHSKGWLGKRSWLEGEGEARGKGKKEEADVVEEHSEISPRALSLSSFLESEVGICISLFAFR